MHILNILCIFATFSWANSEQRSQELFANYLENILKDCVLDVSIVTSQSEYYEDGFPKVAHSVGMWHKANKTLDNFNISAISSNDLQKFVRDADDKHIMTSLYQFLADDSDEGGSINYFDTPELEAPDSTAAEIVRTDGGFSSGLIDEIEYTIDMADHTATMQVLELHNTTGMVKRNKTALFHITPIETLHVSKMSAKMSESVATEVKKAYKIDTTDRAPIIAHLLQTKFPKYKWQILVNATAYRVAQDTVVNVKVGFDEYDIIGKKKEVSY